MNRRSATKVLLSLALVACASALALAQQPAATSQVLLIDGSRSMEGYFEFAGGSGWMEWLQREVTSSRPEIRTLYFVNDRLVESVTKETLGGSTQINKAFLNVTSSARPPSILWFVTDNQPSGGGQAASDDDLEAFYENLRSERVKRIDIFPLQLPYKGPLFLRRPDDSEYEFPGYDGKRGLVLYAVLLDEAATGEYEAAVEGVRVRLSEGLKSVMGVAAESIRAKPLEKDFARLDYSSGRNFRREGEWIIGEGEERGEQFKVGQPISGDFNAVLTSNHGEIEISKADIKVRAEGFNSIDFSDSNVSPEVSPEVIENFGPRDRRELRVTIKMEPVRWQWWNPLAVVRSLNDNRGYIDGYIRLHVQAPPQNFKLVQQLGALSVERQIFSDTSESVQSGIFRLNGLIQKMIPQGGTIDVQPEVEGGPDRLIPVRIGVQYPAWPMALLIILCALPFVIAGLIFWWYRRRPFYRLTWDNGRASACPDFRLWPFIGHPVEIDGRRGASIRKTFSGIKVSAASGYKVDETASKYVNPSGSDFNLSRRQDGAGLTFFFSKTTASGRGDGTKSDSLFPESSYGQNPDADIDGAASNGRPPLRRPTTGATGARSATPRINTPTSGSSTPAPPADSGASDGGDDDW